MEPKLIEISKFIAYHLRHNPEAIDKYGWCEISWLLDKINRDILHETPERGFNAGNLERIVKEDNKHRYEFNEDCTHIRAVQGHSVPVDLELEPIIPGDLVFHGTATRFVDSILEEGLKPKSRQYVHLSSNVDTAYEVGKRHGSPAVFLVRAYAMYKDGYVFYRSKNGVILTKEVPSKYLRLV